MTCRPTRPVVKNRRSAISQITIIVTNRENDAATAAGLRGQLAIPDLPPNAVTSRWCQLQCDSNGVEPHRVGCFFRPLQATDFICCGARASRTKLLLALQQVEERLRNAVTEFNRAINVTRYLPVLRQAFALTDAGADITATDCNGKTALQLAIAHALRRPAGPDAAGVGSCKVR